MPDDTKDLITISEKAELYGQCQFSEDEVLILLGISKSVFDEMYKKRYTFGQLQAQVAVRRALLQKAQSGDNPSIKEFNLLVEKISNKI